VGTTRTSATPSWSSTTFSCNAMSGTLIIFARVPSAQAHSYAATRMDHGALCPSYGAEDCAQIHLHAHRHPDHLDAQVPCMLQYQDQLLPRPRDDGGKVRVAPFCRMPWETNSTTRSPQDFEPIKHMLIDQANRQTRGSRSTVSSHGWLSTSSTTCASTTSMMAPQALSELLQHALPV
jgi:hypothetical protein